MQETQNTKVVQDAYASFLRGDAAGVLALVNDSVVWKGTTGASADVPMAGVRHGRAEVAEFFKLVGAHIAFSRFEPQSYVAQGDRVVALGHYTGRTSVGGSFDSDFVMIFTVRDGRIVEFQEFLDVAQYNAAWAVAAVL
jgi:ketosteroid isomerase-like protein